MDFQSIALPAELPTQLRCGGRFYARRRDLQASLCGSSSVSCQPLRDHMKLYRNSHGTYVERNGQYHALAESWDTLLNAEDLPGMVAKAAKSLPMDRPLGEFLAPIGSQEVWAAGVTYFRSRTARMEESKSA